MQNANVHRKNAPDILAILLNVNTAQNKRPAELLDDKLFERKVNG